MEDLVGEGTQGPEQLVGVVVGGPARRELAEFLDATLDGRPPGCRPARR